MPSDTSPLSPDEYRKFALISVVNLNYNCWIFRFALPDPLSSLNLPVSSCIHVHARLANGEEFSRPYTPISPSSALGYFDLMIKVYPDGKMGQYMKALCVRDQIEVKGPSTKVIYKSNMAKRIGMICGGSGITPILQVLQEGLRTGTSDKTRFDLLFGNISEVDIILREELDKLSAANPDRFKVNYVLSQGSDGWNGLKGYINPEMIVKYMPGPGPDTLMLVCGPPPMMTSILPALVKTLGHERVRVLKF